MKRPLRNQLQRVWVSEARTGNWGGIAGQSGGSDKLSTSCWLTLQRLFLSREEVEISSLLFYFLFFKEHWSSQWHSQMLKSYKCQHPPFSPSYLKNHEAFSYQYAFPLQQDNFFSSWENAWNPNQIPMENLTPSLHILSFLKLGTLYITLENFKHRGSSESLWTASYDKAVEFL